LPIVTDENKWKEALAKYDFNVIFMYQYNAGEGVKDFIFNRIYDPEWVWVYVDKNIVILVRNRAENKQVIDQYQIKYENVSKRLEYLINSKNPRDVLNAADILNLVGRTDLSMPLYLKYVSLRPGDGEIWYVLGKTELRKVDQKSSNPGLAAVYLERAISEGWTTWESYSFLALAYYRTGQLDKVKEAVNKEAKIVPDGEDLKNWRRIISDSESKQNHVE
jgi:tetratricopeptide (TPR) repeat protein